MMLKSTPKKAKTLTDWHDFLTHVTYRPGWRITVCQYLDYNISIQIEADVINAYHHDQTVQLHSSYAANPCYTEADMLTELYNALLQVEKHELCEFLVVNGTRPFDPHAMSGLRYDP